MTEPEKIELAILRTVYQMDASSNALRPVRQSFLQLAKELQDLAALRLTLGLGTDMEIRQDELNMLRKATA